MSNNLRDFGQKKSLEYLDDVRQTLSAVADRFAGFEAEALNVPVDFPLFQRLALPIPSGKIKVPGIKIQDTRMNRLMEVLLHAGTKIGGWRTSPVHSRQAFLDSAARVAQPTRASVGAESPVVGVPRIRPHQWTRQNPSPTASRSLPRQQGAGAAG